jgi:hypothetical protein
VLFQMLAGRLPFQGALTTVLRQIGSDRPPLPSLFNQGLPKDCPLEQICLKMIAKLPEERFASMSEVAAALEALASHHEARVPEASMLSRLRSWTSGIFSSRSAPVGTLAATKEGTPDESANGEQQATLALTQRSE